MATALREQPDGDFGLAPLGRQPPASIEAEQALLGAILIRNEGWQDVAAFLRPEHFADPCHGAIFGAISTLLGRGTQASPTTLATYFEADRELANRGGHAYLGRLAASAITTVNARDYGLAILELAQRRDLIRLHEEMLNRAYDADLDERAAEMAAEGIDRLGEIGRDGPFRFRTARELRFATLEGLGKDLPCTPTGFERLDKAMGGGLFAGKMYGVIARKKAGKTLLGGAIAHNAAATGATVGYIAGEMGGREIEERRFAADIKRNALAFLERTSRRDQKLFDAGGIVADKTTESLAYLDLPGMTFEKLRRACAQFVMTFEQARGLVVDYLQLVRGRPKSTNQAEFLDDVSQWLADFCREHMIWMIVLAQQNQEGNVRGGEGLRLACDQAYELCRTDEGSGSEAWMHMLETRYTRWCDVGTEKDPAFHIDVNHGPVYVELPPLVTEEDARML